jgi:hypothetical protein
MVTLRQNDRQSDNGLFSLDEVAGGHLDDLVRHSAFDPAHGVDKGLLARDWIGGSGGSAVCCGGW